MGCVWEGFGRGLGLQVGAKLSQVGPKIEILASSGCSWAPFGRILVPKSCQNGPQGAPRRLQEWVFGRILVDFLVDFAHIYRQVSRYERHSKSMMILIKIYCQIKIHDQRGNQVERRTRGGSGLRSPHVRSHTTHSLTRACTGALTAAPPRPPTPPRGATW